MAKSFGPKLGSLINAAEGESYTFELRNLLRSYDTLVQGSVLDTSLIAPPVLPLNGDAYIILSGTTPTGVWAGKAGKLAVFSVEITPAGGDVKAPGWEFYTPKPGWRFHVIATNQSVVFDGAAWNAPPTSTINTIYFGGTSLTVTNLKIIANAYRINMAIGDTDLYTVPTGKKALVIDTVCTNPTASGATISPFAEWKTAGVYVKYDVIPSLPVSTYGTASALLPMLFVAGESFAVNTDHAGLSVWPLILEFDATAGISIAKMSTFAVGDNTLLVVPANGIQLLPFIASASASAIMRGQVFYFNNSGATRTLGWNAVPSGGSTNLNNAFGFGISVSPLAISTKSFYGGLAAGDSITINVDASTAGQAAYILYRTLP